MRLTKKLDNCYHIIHNWSARNTFEDQNKENFALQKLGQLEDIEDELGIDLITYVKATTQPTLYIKNIPFDNEIKTVFMEAITIDDKSKDYLIWFSCGKGKKYLFSLKDYGKTWALTKEELK